MPLYAFVILATGWIAWAAPFFFAPKGSRAISRIDHRARWGIALQLIGYSILWQSKFWTRSPESWQTALSVLFLSLAALLSATAKHALGRQWRIDAGLNRDHELVRSGPYRVIRHPIYASMLCLLLGTGFLIASWPYFLAATLVTITGTEIRVRVEDALLASHFGDQFSEYQRTVPAYIPFL